MVSSQQVAWLQSQHEPGETIPTLEDALTNLDNWLNDTVVRSMSTEEYERRTVWGLSTRG